MTEGILSKISAVCALSLLVMCVTAGCSGNTDSDKSVPDNTAETTVTEPATENENIAVQSGDQDENIHIQIQDFNKTFNRYNDYTGEVEYSYQIDEVEASWESDSTGCDIKLLYTGKKTYDAKGSDVARPVKSEVRLIDEDGYVIESFTFYSEEALCEGDTFEKEEFECTTFNMDNIQLQDGNYTLEFISEDANTASLAGSDGDKPDPERYYCPDIIEFPRDEELPFDFDDEWVRFFKMKNVYITDDGILKGFFKEDFDLSGADNIREAESSYDPAYDYDIYYGKTIFYTIDNPEEYLIGVPEEAMPSDIGVVFYPEGESIVGQRRCVLINLHYKHNKEDESHYASFAFMYFPGNALTEDEWNAVLENAESLGAEVPQ